MTRGLQCVAVCCRLLWRVAQCFSDTVANVNASVLKYVAHSQKLGFEQHDCANRKRTHGKGLAMCCSVLQHCAVYCIMTYNTMRERLGAFHI